MEWVNTEKVLDEIGKEFKQLAKSNLKKYKAIATGKLYNSIDYKVIPNDDGSISLAFMAESYWINVEKGRKAGSKLPPIKVIKQWMINRKLPKEVNVYQIARSIADNGIKAKPFISGAIKGLSNINQRLEEAIDKDINLNLKTNSK